MIDDLDRGATPIFATDNLLTELERCSQPKISDTPTRDDLERQTPPVSSVVPPDVQGSLMDSAPAANPTAADIELSSATQTMRVDVRKLNDLINLVGELVLERNRLLQLVNDGIVALLWVSSHEFRRSIEQARADRVPLHVAEETLLGTTHCEAGKIIATSWHLPQELIEVIACHHAPALATANRALTGLVSVSDLLCRLGGLGYGYREDHETNFAEEPGFTILAGQYPAIRPLDLARFTFEMDAVLEEVQAVVSRVYGLAQ